MTRDAQVVACLAIFALAACATFRYGALQNRFSGSAVGCPNSENPGVCRTRADAEQVVKDAEEYLALCQQGEGNDRSCSAEQGKVRQAKDLLVPFQQQDDRDACRAGRVDVCATLAEGILAGEGPMSDPKAIGDSIIELCNDACATKKDERCCRVIKRYNSTHYTVSSRDMAVSNACLNECMTRRRGCDALTGNGVGTSCLADEQACAASCRVAPPPVQTAAPVLGTGQGQ